MYLQSKILHKRIVFFLALLLSGVSGFSQNANPFSGNLTPLVISELDAVEYFYDKDPGFGKGYPIPVTNGNNVQLNNVSLSGIDTLAPGLHQLFIRARNLSGNWSVSAQSVFYKMKATSLIKPEGVSDITRVEYFFDRDPGLGNGIAIPVTAGADVSLSNVVIGSLDTLKPGFHSLFVRAQNFAGSWSITNRTDLIVVRPNFGIKDNLLSGIIKAEYFFNTDPGFGNGTSIPLTSGTEQNLSNIIIGGLDTLKPGFHTLNIRMQNADGLWSLTNRANLMVVRPNFGIKDNALSNIVRVEYFFNEDPGFGNGNHIPLSPGNHVALNNVTITDIDQLPNGLHQLYVRAQDALGRWSLSNIASIFISSPEFSVKPSPALSNIKEIEYFIDSDPGIGNGTRVPVSGDPGLENFAFQVDLSSVAVGDHLLYIRVKDESGNWSIRVIEPFKIHLPVPQDIQVLSLDLEDGECQLTDATEIKVNLFNGGDDPISGFDIVYLINDSISVTETITEQLAPSTGLVYTFAQKADLSAIGTYNVVVYTMLANDDRPENDTLTKVIEHHPPVNKGVSSDVTTCYGEQIILSAFGGGSYLWSTGANSAALTVTPQASTRYYVTITDQNNCVRYDSVNVTVLPALAKPVISVLGDTAVCSGGTITLTTDKGESVEWFMVQGDDNVSMGKSVTLSATAAGAYFARYKSATDCQVNSELFDVQILPRPAVTATPEVASICVGDTITLTVQYAETYQWSSGQTSSSIEVSPTETTTYYVTGSNSLGCAYSDSITVTVLPAQPPGKVSSHSPPNQSLDIELPVDLTWAPAENASSYDVYLWRAGTNKPSSPTQSDINGLAYRYAPHGSVPGISYYWTVTAKNSCFKTEGDTLKFTTGHLPDLIVSSFQVTSNSAAGSKITVEYEVKNIGEGSTRSQSWKDRIWLSADKDLRKADDILLGEYDNLGYLQPGDSYFQTKEVTIPRHITGTYYLFVITDNDDAYCIGGKMTDGECTGERGYHTHSVRESNEQNNFVYSLITINQPPLPDLVVKSVGAPTDAFSNDQITVQYQVKNEGDYEALSEIFSISSCMPSQSSSGDNPPIVLPVRSYYWEDAIYISSDSIFDINRAKRLGTDRVYVGHLDIAHCQFANPALKVDHTYDHSITVRIPAEYQGTYYLYIVANNLGVFESSYSNNVFRSDPLTVRLTPPADLVVSDVDVPAAAHAGEKMTMAFTVENQGVNPPLRNGWRDKIYLSADETFDVSKATLIGTKTYSGSASTLTTGNSYTVEGAYDIPRNLTGSFYVYVHTDAESQVFEFDKEGNNVTRSVIPVDISFGNRPDLVVSSMELPDSITIGRSFPIKWTVRNSGTKAAMGTWSDRVYWSASKDFHSGSPRYLGALTYSGTLDVSGSYNRRLMVEVSTSVPDSVTFFVFTDYNDSVFEESETNNVSSHHDFDIATPVLITPPPAPVNPVAYIDLKAESLTVPEEAMSGSVISLSYSVKNLSAASSAVRWKDGIYLSKDSIPGTDAILLETINMSSISGGATYTKNISPRIPNGLSGSYYVILYTDAGGAARDTIRSNNTIAKAIQINLTSPPDLVVSSFEVPAELYPGQKLMVPFTVENIGTGPANGKWFDAVYLSRSPEPDQSKILIGQRAQNGPLNAGAGYTDSIPVTIPMSVHGHYYLVVMTDYDNRVYEHGMEDNNARYSLVSIVIPQPADFIITELTVPDTAYLGDQITTNYIVKNIGENPTVGSFTDAVYLSANKSFNPATARLLQTGVRNNLLQPNESRSFSLSGPINSVFPGEYFGIARTNITGSVTESNLNNNILASDDKIHVKIDELQLDVPMNVFLSSARNRYFKVDVAEDLDLVVTLTGSGSQVRNEIYIAFGRVPTENDYDAKGNVPLATTQRMIIPGTESGSYYLLVKSHNSTAQATSLLAKTLPFGLTAAAPAKLGQGIASVQVEGAGFRNGIRFELRVPGTGTVVATAKELNLKSSMEAGLLWDLKAVNLGVYDLVAVNPDSSEARLANGITVETSTGFRLDHRVLAPDLLRRGKTGFYDLVIKNTGNVDIPFVLTTIAVEEAHNVLQTRTSGNVMDFKEMNPGVDQEQFKEYYTIQNHKVIPFHTRNLVVGEEFKVSVLFDNFIRNYFSATVEAEALDREEYMSKMISGIEMMRNVAKYNPHFFGSEEFNQIVDNEEEFMHMLLSEYIRIGMISASDTIGITACTTCGIPSGDQPGYVYGNPNVGPEYILYPYVDLGKGQSYHWKINNYRGFPGSWNGWSMIHAQGPLNITATAQQPFTVRLNSLDFFNRPGYLGAFAAAFDKCFPIAIANGGIVGFHKDKFVIDTSEFVRYNLTHGGRFSIELHGDTLMLCFKARKPGIGEDGIPGGPGGFGQDGAPGGDGGPGDENTPAGKGGMGGAGGYGYADRVAGKGGKGGKGGKNIDDTWEEDGPDGPDGPDDPPLGAPPPAAPPNLPEGTPPLAPPSGPIPPGVPPATPPVAPPGGGAPKGMEPGAPAPMPLPGFPPAGGPPGAPPVSSCGEPAFSAMQWLGCQGAPWLLGCGLSMYGCYSFMISFGAEVGFVAGALGAGVGAIAGATVGSLVGTAIAIYSCGTGLETCGAGELTLPGKVLKFVTCRPVVSSCDPNEIQGPEGYGTEKFVSNTEQLPYTILYENDPEFASAPAQRVVITLPIDENLDPVTLKLGNFGFGKYLFTVPEGVSNYTTRLNLADSIGFDVNVTAGLDVVNREAIWIFQSIDPKTGLSPEDPLAGYLPVNDSTGKGEGFVSFTIQAMTSTQTGDSIRAQADIVFDINAPIITNTEVNIIDAAAPQSQITELESLDFNSVINMKVSATDDPGGSGVKHFELYYSENGAPFVRFDSVYTDYTISFVANEGSSYCFHTRATDQVGNVESAKNMCEIFLELAGPVGVDWMYFNARFVGEDVVLDWATSAENNSKSFVIERSADAMNFHSIGSVNAQVNKVGTTAYKFTDYDVSLTGKNVLYYRLRQIDQDGKYSYSRIVSVQVRNKNDEVKVSVYPNPFRETTTISVSTPGPAFASDLIQIYSVDGILIYERSIADRLPSDQLVLDKLPRLAGGVYLLKVRLNGVVKTLKLIKN